MTTPLSPLTSEMQPKATLDPERTLCEHISTLFRPFIRVLPFAIASLPSLHVTPAFNLPYLVVPVTPTTLFFTLFATKMAAATPTPTSSSLNITDFLITTYTTDQRYPSTVGLSDGGFVVTWYGEGQGDTTNGIFGQRYHVNGTAYGAEFRANTYTANSQRHPSVAGLTDGGFVVTWRGEGQGDTQGIFGQRYHANGTAYGAEFRANTYTTNIQWYPSVASLTDGGFVVTWHGAGQGDSYGIFGERYHANSTAYSTEFRANTYTANNQQYPSAAGLSDGGFVVTWQSEEQPSSLVYDIYGKRYDCFGEPIPWEQAPFTLLTPPFNSATSAASSLPPSPTSQTISRTSPFASFSPSINPLFSASNPRTGRAGSSSFSSATSPNLTSPPLTILSTHTSPSGLLSFSSSLSPSRYAAPSWTLRLFSSIEILYQQPVDIVFNSQVIGTFVFSGGEGSLNSTNPNILNLNFDPSFFPEDGQTIPLFAISEGDLQDWQNIFLGGFTDCNDEGFSIVIGEPLTVRHRDALLIQRCEKSSLQQTEPRNCIPGLWIRGGNKLN